MTTLTDFLLARIAEDENRAQRFWDEWSREGGVIDVSRYVGPTQTLAECEAKRRIVTFARLQDEMYHHRPSDFQQGATGASWEALRHLATIYADHPDFVSAWT